LCVCGRERGHGLPEHPHEVVDLFWRHGMADILAGGIAGNRPIRVRNQFAVFAEEGEEGQAGAFGTKLGLERFAAGSVEDGLVAALLHVDARDRKVPGKDRLDCGSLDKPIEALAPPSPGGAENQKDISVLRGGLRFGAVEHLLGGRRACCCQRRHSNEQGQYCRPKDGFHGGILWLSGAMCQSGLVQWVGRELSLAIHAVAHFG